MPYNLLIQAQTVVSKGTDMIILLLVIAFVIISTVFVIAAGILSSRLSREEDWIEIYGKVAINEESVTLEQYSAQLKKWF